MTMRKCDLVILALYRIREHRGEFVQPHEATQLGIAEIIGISRAHTSTVLASLIKAGYAEGGLSHARGAPRSLMCYCLSETGYAHAAELVRSIGGEGNIDAAIRAEIPPEAEHVSIARMREDLRELEKKCRTLERRIDRLEALA